jgi:membrane protein DedA with SNARE-associated domain
VNTAFSVTAPSSNDQSGHFGQAGVTVGIRLARSLSWVGQSKSSIQGLLALTQIMEQISGWIEELIVTIGYPGIALVMVIENVFPPIPSELVLPFAGALSAKGELAFWGVVAAGVAGSLVGALVLYGVGWWARQAGVRILVATYGKYLFVSEKDLDRGAAWFQRYGEAVVFFGRLIPIVRSVISIPAGYTRMPARRFLLYTTTGTAVWSLALAYVGRLLGQNWAEITTFMKPYQNGTMALLALAVFVFIGWRAMRHNR